MKSETKEGMVCKNQSYNQLINYITRIKMNIDTWIILIRCIHMYTKKEQN